MKKFIKFAGLCMMLSLLLVACGSKTSNVTSLEGKWGLTAASMGGVDITAQMKEMTGGNLDSMFYCEFTKDGKAYLFVGGQKNEGTYTFDGKKIIIDDGVEKTEAILDGNSFTMVNEKEKGKMTYTKK